MTNTKDSDDNSGIAPPPAPAPGDDTLMRYEYRTLTIAECDRLRELNDAGLVFVKLCAAIGTSRELSLAVTRMEEAVMWAVKHVTK